MGKLLATAFVAVVLLAGVLVFIGTRGNSEDADDPLTPETVARVTPAGIVNTPEVFFRQPVVVRGEVVAVGDERRFALRGKDRAILVQGEPTTTRPERGSQVTVTGVVSRIGRAQSTGIADLGGASVAEGAPFISADRIDTTS